MTTDLIIDSMAGLTEELNAMFFNLPEKYKAFFNRQQDMEAVISVQHPRFGTLNHKSTLDIFMKWRFFNVY